MFEDEVTGKSADKVVPVTSTHEEEVQAGSTAMPRAISPAAAVTPVTPPEPLLPPR